MVEIKKCHVCGSENIVENVELHRGDNLPLSVSCYTNKTWLDGRKESSKVWLRASICKDCGTVRTYVENLKLDWIAPLRRSKEQEWTLKNKIITYGLIGLFVFVVFFWSYEIIYEGMKIRKVETEIPQLVVPAMQRYYICTDKKITSLDDLTVEVVGIDGQKHGPFIYDNRDPWGNPFKYDSEALIIISAGPDKIFGTKDDIRVKIVRDIYLEDDDSLNSQLGVDVNKRFFKGTRS